MKPLRKIVIKRGRILSCSESPISRIWYSDLCAISYCISRRIQIVYHADNNSYDCCEKKRIIAMAKIYREGALNPKSLRYSALHSLPSLYPSHLFFRHKSESPIGPAGTERERDLSLVQRMRDKMHWELRISPSVRRSEIFPIEKHPTGRGL